MIQRTIEKELANKLDFDKALILLGPRQVGKTTIVRKIAAQVDPNYLYVNGDDPAVRLQWANTNQNFINKFIERQKVIVFDEAQRIDNIGLSIKMIVDAKQGVQVIVSGSSSLEIASKINEPLTGRKWEFRLYPLSWKEVENHFTFGSAYARLNQFLVTGFYPEIVTKPHQSEDLLENLAGSYLYKDILEMGGVRKPAVLLRLLQALAWQVGGLVSYNELGQTVGTDKATIGRYIDLLEKSFVIFVVHPFSRNLRNEISKSKKIYFFDNGIRNTLINNYAPLEQRDDVGILWENYLMGEMKKHLAYSKGISNMYFWRSKDKAEIDYIEERNGVLRAFEFKWKQGKKYNFPPSFMKQYNPSVSAIVTRDNFWDYL